MLGQDTLRQAQLAPIKVLIYAEGDTSIIPFEIYNFLQADPSIDPTISYEPSAFNSLEKLQSYDGILMATKSSLSWAFNQRLNLQSFLEQGGGFVGIARAAEAFDDSFYRKRIGARITTLADSFSIMDLEKEGYHLITEAFPSPWKTGEYIPSYEIISPDIKPLLSYQNMPIAWYQDHAYVNDSSRSFYVAIGEDPLTYSNNPLFQKLIKRALHWSAFRLANPSPNPPGLAIIRPKVGKTFKRYPKNVGVNLRIQETALSGEVDSLAVFLNDSLYKSLPRLENFSLFVNKPGLYELIIRAYTNKGNYISAATNFAIRDEAGLGLAISVDHKPEYQVGDSLMLHALVIHPDDTTASDTPRDFGGELKLYLGDELLVSAQKSPFSYGLILPKSGDLLFKATAKSDDLIGEDSLFLFVSGDEMEETITREKESITISPNPVKDILSFSFESSEEGFAKWEIITLSGELIRSESFLKELNPTIVEIDVSDLEVGIYILRIRIGDETYSGKFIKVLP